MDTIILRKLTLKSCFEEGKFANVPVGTLIDLGHTRFLRWYYYNLSNISFVPEVLEMIGITPEWEIKKPGTNKEIGETLALFKKQTMGDKNRMAAYQKDKKKNKYIFTKSLDKTSKAQLMAKNHGH